MKNISPIKLAKKIFPLNRSLTGKGNLETLQIFQNICKNIKIKNFKSGKKVFDWKIPNEWNVNQAYIINPQGQKICDFKKNNLHLVGYSSSIEKTINLSDLKKKLHFHSELKNAIPYLTSYYKKDWGFCISKNNFEKLKKGKYHIKIDTIFKKGKMHYGECVIKGKFKKEIMISTYICHPSMANNEISGPVVSTMIAKWLSKKNLKYSYRIIFVPETIGSIAYIHKNIQRLKRNIIAGFNITCVGDERTWSFLPSRNGNTLSDYIAKKTLVELKKKFKIYDWLERGSDERQYCSPGVDLPVCSVMRSKYGTYPEYHSSLDQIKTVVTKKGLSQSINFYKKLISNLEKSTFPITKINCEPKLSKRNLYPTINKKGKKNFGNQILNFLTFADGQYTMEDIYSKLKVKKKKFNEIINILKKNKLIKINQTPKNKK